MQKHLEERVQDHQWGIVPKNSGLKIRKSNVVFY